MKKFLLSIACLLACGTSFAQKTVKIAGKVSDEKKAPLAYALVKLVKYEDSTVVKNIQTGFDGAFEFDQVTPGNYLLLTNMVGYKANKSSKLVVGEIDITHAAITLQSLTNQLKEVAIVGKKPYIEHKIDKTVVNVESSIVATGSTALEVLEKAPGVSIDRQSEQIRLNNKAGIMVMIDGKANFLSGADLTTLLSNMSSDQIATIELISNPSSKYDAAGSAGIINIKLKRNKNFGTNGSLALNGGQALMPNSPNQLYRTGVFLNLNHRVNKWNVFGNAGYAKKANFNEITVDRTTSSQDFKSAFNQNFERLNTGIGYTGKLGADYFASEKTVFGVMVDANTLATSIDNYSYTSINELKNNIASSNGVNQQANSKSPANNLTANFNFRHDFDKDGTNLSFDADYSGFNNKKKEAFDASYLDAAGSLALKTALQNNTVANIDIYAAKTDFTLPISKTIKIETGLKSSYVITNNDFLSEELSNGVWVNNIGKSNQFIYKENINAAYLNFAKEWSKWQIQLGLRAEHTHSNGNSVTSNTEVDRNYLSLFPTLFINQTLGKDQNIRYSYSRRVDRPNYQQLNPFVFYMDPYALDQGNPYLKPQFTSNFEIGYSYKQISFALNYADTRDMITQISEQDDVSRIVSVIRKNLGRAQYYSANLYVPIKLAKFWNMQNNVSLYYSKFNDPNLEAGGFNANKVAYNLNSSQSFVLPKNLTLELSFWLNSPKVNGVEQTTITQYAFNLGIQKSVLNKQLKFRASIDDIFLTNHWEGRLQYRNIDMTVVNRYTSRRVAFNVSYSFGNQNVKSARARKTATDEIKNRAN